MAVAWVGNPKNKPALPVLAANTSAAANAASVFPTPICASKIRMPGCIASSAAFIIVF